MIREELDRAAAGLRPDEVARGKGSVRGSRMLALEDPFARMNRLGHAELVVGELPEHRLRFSAHRGGHEDDVAARGGPADPERPPPRSSSDPMPQAWQPGSRRMAARSSAGRCSRLGDMNCRFASRWSALPVGWASRSARPWNPTRTWFWWTGSMWGTTSAGSAGTTADVAVDFTTPACRDGQPGGLHRGGGAHGGRDHRLQRRTAGPGPGAAGRPARCRMRDRAQLRHRRGPDDEVRRTGGALV